MEKRHRIFIAINLPAEVKKELGFYAEKWPELPAKWTEKENLHITLEFLGHITDEELVDVCSAVKEVSKRHVPFSIVLSKVCYGPPKKMSYSQTSFETDSTSPSAKYRAPRMVWVEGEKSDDIADLKDDLQDFLTEKVSYRPDEKGFSPHITLARINEWEFRKIEPEERPEVNEDIDLVFTVESIEVMESELKRSGPVYTILESHNLR